MSARVALSATENFKRFKKDLLQQNPAMTLSQEEEAKYASETTLPRSMVCFTASQGGMGFVWARSGVMIIQRNLIPRKEGKDSLFFEYEASDVQTKQQLRLRAFRFPSKEANYQRYVELLSAHLPQAAKKLQLGVVLGCPASAGQDFSAISEHPFYLLVVV